MAHLKTMVVALFLCQSCTIIEHIALDTTAGLLQKATKEIETETNWMLFKNAAPSSIKLIEGLSYTNPENLDLLAALTKAYAGYGFGVNETLYLGDKLGKAANLPHLEQTIHSYSKSMHYGFSFLKLRGISYPNLVNQSKNNALNAYLDTHLDGAETQDLESVFFTGQAWAGLINLRKQNTDLISQVYIAMALIDWVCGYKPDFQNGACHMASGIYDLSRPKLLGGNPDKGEATLRKAIEKFPNNYLIRVAFIEAFIIPRMDKKQFLIQKEFLLKAFIEAPSSGPAEPAIRNKNALLNAIAKKRFKIILQYEKDLFL